MATKTLLPHGRGSEKPPGIVVAAEGAEGEGLGDVVAEGGGGVGAGAVGFVEVGAGLAGRIEGPGYLFEVTNEFAAFGIDEDGGLAEGVLEARIDTIYTVADGWIAGYGTY